MYREVDMEKKYRILFATPGFYGHVAVALPIAKHLLADRKSVV
jgi:UDP:flavonoid glycosyltransferase YjiC (YdhE family)